MSYSQAFCLYQGPRSTPEMYLRKAYNSLRCMTRPCSGTPWGRMVILLYRQALNSMLHPCLPLTLLTPRSLPDEIVRVAPCTVARTSCRLMSCTTPLSKLSAFYVTWYMDREIILGWDVLFPESKEAYQITLLPSLWWKIQDMICLILWRWNPDMLLTTGLLKTSLNW